MKVIWKLLVILLCISNNVFAQKNFKFGHINSSVLLAAMPERDSAQAQLKEYSEQLGAQIEEMQVELNNKYQEYLTKRETFSDLIRDAKEKELQDLQQRIQEFQVTAQQDYQQKENKLLQPIIDKATKAIKAVGKENGFTYIFDISAGVVIYHSSDSEDILPLVKKKLSIE